MNYFWALMTLALFSFLIRKSSTIGKVFDPLKDITYLKIPYFIAGLFLVLFFPDSFLEMYDRASGSVLMFCLSWIGFYYGCGLELRGHQRLSSRIIIYSIIEPIIIFFAILTAGMLFAYIVFKGFDRSYVVIVIALFCSLTVFRRHGILYRDGEYTAHTVHDHLPPVGNLLSVTALSIIGYISIGNDPLLIFGLPFSGAFAFFIFQFIVGIATGIILNMMVTGAKSNDAISIILIGGTALTGGLAYTFSFSPLLVGALSGAFLINSSLKRLQTLEALNSIHDHVEKIFMFFIGALLTRLVVDSEFDLSFIFGAAIGFFILRTVLKYILAHYWVSQYREHGRSVLILWIGLTGQGILAAGAALELHMYIPEKPSVLLLLLLLLIMNQFAVALFALKTDVLKKPEGQNNA